MTRAPARRRNTSWTPAGYEAAAVPRRRSRARRARGSQWRGLSTVAVSNYLAARAPGHYRTQDARTIRGRGTRGRAHRLRRPAARRTPAAAAHTRGPGALPG